MDSRRNAHCMIFIQTRIRLYLTQGHFIVRAHAQID